MEFGRVAIATGVGGRVGLLVKMAADDVVSVEISTGASGEDGITGDSSGTGSADVVTGTEVSAGIDATVGDGSAKLVEG